MKEQMTRAEKIRKISRLCEINDIPKRADESFKKAYPNAPQDMIHTAVFHVYVDGVDAVLDWLVAATAFLDDPTRRLDDTFHVLYHLYNWQQFEALLPNGSSELTEWLDGLKESVKQDDRQKILHHMERIEQILEGDRPPPMLQE